MDIRKAGVSDVVLVAELSVQLWPDNTLEEMKAEFDAFVRRQDVALFLAYDEGTAVGFAQCQLRHDYVEGTDSSPVGYLEGIYVEPSYRNRDAPGRCCTPARNGRQMRAVRNLPATANLTMSKAFVST